MNQPKILLVDDVDFFIDVERRFLAQTPAAILIARSGREALDVALREAPALVYLDVHMPEMDGIGCLRLLKGDPRLRLIPVVMVMAPGKGVTEEDCRAAGADGVVFKPLERSAFLETGRRLLFHIERREKRVPCQALVTLRRGGEEIHCSSEDLSVHGAYINCRHAVAKGETLTLGMLLPGSAAVLEVRAEVAWVNQGFPRPRLKLPQGFGVTFREVAAETAAALRDFVARYDLPGRRG